ncbi:MAG: hypothetical protein OXR67_08850 [Chloroflexota bacterium]|nr:hypothetical protein [Chloroflexota bacterium]
MRLGINVPDGLIQRVKEAEPDVNISQVCREALEGLVARQQLAKRRVHNDGVTERILELSHSQDNPLVEPDWAGYAFDDAKEWVSKVSLDEWDDFCESYDYDESSGRNFDSVVMCFGNFFKWEHENDTWFRQRYRQLRGIGGYGEILDSAKKKYNEAWLSYVMEVRKKQSEFFEAEYKKFMEEVGKRNQSRPAPEVPPHLLEKKEAG